MTDTSRTRVTFAGRNGMVAAGRGPVRGFRAELDALPILEGTGLSYASDISGQMHACGHDGHMAMLLGALRWLTRNRNFSGSVVGIFQPAEEGGAGAKAMLEDGLIDRFRLQRIYGMHNMPGMPLGSFAIGPGPIMAASDRFEITFQGAGGHASTPHLGSDPIVAAGAAITILQSLVARNIDPRDPLVVSVTAIESGNTFNVIPDRACMKGTIRSLSLQARKIGRERLHEIVQGIGKSLRVDVSIEYVTGYPATINPVDVTSEIRAMLTAWLGESCLDDVIAPVMASEDFSYFLEACPGSFVLVGKGRR